MNSNDLFGKAVVDAEGVVTAYTGGVIHTWHSCDMPERVVMQAIVDADWGNLLGTSDYAELANLIMFCRKNDYTAEQTNECLGDWEVHSGCYYDHNFVGLIISRLHW